MAMGNLNGTYRHLLAAPHALKPTLLQCIDHEIIKQQNGRQGYLDMKMNSLTDRALIDKMAEASPAGGNIKLVIRGICCLGPGVEGYSDNIRIKSIVGRYLEHSRIFIFGADEDTQRIFMGSGDLLNRNTRRRVEVFTEVKSADAGRDIKRLVDAIRMDNQNSWQMLADGSYLKDTSDHAEPLDSHKYLHEYFEKPLELPAKKHSLRERLFEHFHHK